MKPASEMLKDVTVTASAKVMLGPKLNATKLSLDENKLRLKRLRNGAVIQKRSSMQRPSKRQKRRVKLSARSEQRPIRPKNKKDWRVSS